MRIRKLYGVGVGPGDPELLTLRAYKVLKEVEIIVAPRSGAGRRSLALLAVKKVLDERERKPIVVEPLFPMTKDENELRMHWEHAKRQVLQRCRVSVDGDGDADKDRDADEYNSAGDFSAGEKTEGISCCDVAFITLGDPSLYSTFYKFLRLFDEDEIEDVEVIPGVPSFAACSALAKLPVAEGDEIVSIVPNASGERAVHVIKNADSLIFLKPKNMDLIKNALGDGLAVLCVRIGFDAQEFIMGRLFDMKAPGHYLSTLIVKRGWREVESGGREVEHGEREIESGK